MTAIGTTTRMTLWKMMKMTIEEAIKHCEEKAKGCSQCASEHDQLAAWLKELVKLRENQSKYEKALHLAAADALGLELGQTNEARERMISDVSRRYKQWTGIKE